MGKKKSGLPREDPTAGMNHMQIFQYLVKVGPYMHGKPGARKPKGGGK